MDVRWISRSFYSIYLCWTLERLEQVTRLKRNVTREGFGEGFVRILWIIFAG